VQITSIDTWNNNNSNMYNKQWHVPSKISINNPNTKLFTVPGVWCSSMLRVYGCVFCFISLLSVYMCVCMPSSSRSIAGVPSSRGLPGWSWLPLLLHTTCVRSCCKRANCVAAQQQKNKIKIDKQYWDRGCGGKTL